MTEVQKYSKRYLDKEIQIIESSDRRGVIPELNVYEKAVIYRYSDFGFESVNERLRDSEGKNISDFGELLDKALIKLPDYKGIVYRGVRLNSSELKKYKEAFEKNITICEHSFVSTTKSRLIAMEYSKNTLFRISSRTGKEIEKIAKFGIFNPSNEKEVLFNFNTNFTILDIGEEKGYTLITMEEAV